MWVALKACKGFHWILGDCMLSQRVWTTPGMGVDTSQRGPARHGAWGSPLTPPPPAEAEFSQGRSHQC